MEKKKIITEEKFKEVMNEIKRLVEGLSEYNNVTITVFSHLYDDEKKMSIDSRAEVIYDTTFSHCAWILYRLQNDDNLRELVLDYVKIHLLELLKQEQE